MDAKEPVFLVVRHPGGAISRLALDGSPVSIGRDRDATVSLPSHGVSRRHAELLLDPYGRWLIRDLHSKHGIRVDGFKVSESVLLPTQQVRIDEYILEIEKQGSAMAAWDAGSSVEMIDDASEIATLSKGIDPPKISAAHLAHIRRLGDTLSRFEDTSARFSAVCDLWSRPEFNERFAAVVRVTPGDMSQSVQVMHCVSLDSDVTERRYISRRLVRFVADTRAAALGSNKTDEAADVLISVFSEVRHQAAAACPLRTEGAFLDLLYVDLSPELATTEWLMLASLVAAEFQRAEVVWASRKQAEESAAILRELEHAARVQKRLLPKVLNIEGLDISLGFEPCRWVGGDYLDVVPLADGRVFLVIADVCGHGIPAALMASSVHTAIHAGLRAGLDVAELPRVLNDHLCATLPPGHFVTMVCVLLDPRAGLMQSASFGHPPALILSADSSVRRLKSGEHAPLGIDAFDIAWEKSRLDSGDVLVLYTDGITEMMDQEGKMLDESGFCAILHSARSSRPACNVSELSAAFFDAINKFGGDRLALDDRTYLLVSRVLARVKQT